MQKTLSDFVDKEIMPTQDKIDDDVTHEQVVTPILKKLQVGPGYQKNKVPQDFGGNQQLSMVGDSLIMEQLARERSRNSLEVALLWCDCPRAISPGGHL
jgi:alkylation response protein AidB-like acyl-CoA dehydrogenase